MAKRIVNKAERNAEKGMTLKKQATDYLRTARMEKTFDRLMPLIVSEQNIILA